MSRIAVVGAGVSGLSAAINVQRAFRNSKVTIIADGFGPDLVSNGAGGLFRPYLGDVQDTGSGGEITKQCYRDSFKHFSSLAMSDKAKDSGQTFVSGTMAYNESRDAGYELMRELAFDFHNIPPSELKRRGIPYKYGYNCTTVISQMPVYLRWLMEQFKAEGGTVQRRTLKDIKELYGDYQLVINCCGQRAETLLGDKECFPVRGQLAAVRAPWIKQFFFSESLQVMPQPDKVLIGGGIRVKGNYSTAVDPELEDDLFKRAEAIFPEFKGAEKLPGWAGLRPGRTQLRLEYEIMDLGNNRKLPVVHNYGHVGHGVSLSWGAGMQCAKLAKEAILSIPPKASL